MNRRDFLKALAFIPFAQYAEAAQTTSTPIPGQGAQDFWSRPRMVDLQRKDTSERFAIVYWRNGMLDKAGYQKACEVLRDAHVNEIYPMDIRLLDLVCATQAWIRYYGFNAPYLVNSGYRSPKTNARIEGAARNSKHMAGQAIDFTVPGLPADYMGRLAQSFIKTDGLGGGVGFYTTAQFTHMDTGRGPERAWVR